jgi:DNA primase
MGILDEDVARVRDSTDLVTLIGEKVALRRVGQRHVGLCPFHQEKTPSFSVNPAMGFFHCFGCNRSGDAITWMRETEGLDFVESIEALAQRAGVTLRYDDRAQAKDKSRKTRLSEAVGAAIEFYHRRLLEVDDGGPARAYLRSRGFDGDAARRFLLGWAPDDWDLLARHLQQERKLSRDDIVGAGLAFVNKANRLQDQFRRRLLFPIHDGRGEPAGFGGRALGDEGPKYKNSPETPIYQKSRLLYGLHWAKGEIVAKGDVIICEGYTDVMAYALAGAPNAIATCGTALADEHVRSLKNLTRAVTLAYDADAAGQGAAEQWYRWEQEFDIQVRVADLPPGRDPGDLWQHDRPRLLASLEHAQPFLQFRVDRALAAADVSSIEGRSRGAERAAAIVGQHPSDLVRDQYVMQVAGRLDIDADRLRDAVARAARGDRRSARGGPPAPEAPSDTAPAFDTKADAREIDLLRWAVHEPPVVNEWLQPELFLSPVAREAFVVLAGHKDFHEALAAAEGATRRLLERLAVEEPTDDEHETLSARLLVINVEPVAQRLYVSMMREGDERAGDVKRALDDLAHEREIGEWERAQEPANRLLGWVVHEARARADVDVAPAVGSLGDEQTQDRSQSPQHPEERVEQEA